MNDVGQLNPILKQIRLLKLLHNQNLRIFPGLLLLSLLGDLLECLKLLNGMGFSSTLFTISISTSTHAAPSLNIEKKNNGEGTLGSYKK